MFEYWCVEIEKSEVGNHEFTVIPPHKIVVDIDFHVKNVAYYEKDNKTYWYFNSQYDAGVFELGLKLGIEMAYNKLVNKTIKYVPASRLN